MTNQLDIVRGDECLDRGRTEEVHLVGARRQQSRPCASQGIVDISRVDHDFRDARAEMRDPRLEPLGAHHPGVDASAELSRSNAE